MLHETCDDGNVTSGDGCSSSCRLETKITAHWTLEDSAGQPQPCPAGFDTVELIPLSARLAGPIFRFPCAAGQGTIELLEVPRSITGALLMRVTRSDTQAVFGEAMALDIHPERGVPIDVSLRLITDIGRLHLHWTMSEAGAPKSCAALGVSAIRIDVIPMTGPTVTLTGSCGLGDYPTAFLPTGTYRIEMSASSANGPGFGARDGVAVPTGSLIADVPPIDIAF